MNDGINTLDPDSELRLTIMSSIAQDESRKKLLDLNVAGHLSDGDFAVMAKEIGRQPAAHPRSRKKNISAGHMGKRPGEKAKRQMAGK